MCEYSGLCFESTPGRFIKSKAEEFTLEILHLAEQKVFNIHAFECLIDKIRSHVAEVSFCFSRHFLNYIFVVLFIKTFYV